MVVDINRYRRALTRERTRDILYDLRTSHRMNDHWMLWAFPRKCKKDTADPMERYYGIKKREEVLYFLEDYELSDYYQEALYSIRERMERDRGFVLAEFFDKDYNHFCSHIHLFYQVAYDYMDHGDVLYQFISDLFQEISRTS